MNDKQPADWQDRMMLYYDSEIAQMYRRRIERLTTALHRADAVNDSLREERDKCQQAWRLRERRERDEGTAVLTAAQLGHHTGDTGE